MVNKQIHAHAEYVRLQRFYSNDDIEAKLTRTKDTLFLKCILRAGLRTRIHSIAPKVSLPFLDDEYSSVSCKVFI